MGVVECGNCKAWESQSEEVAWLESCGLREQRSVGVAECKTEVRGSWVCG